MRSTRSARRRAVGALLVACGLSMPAIAGHAAASALQDQTMTVTPEASTTLSARQRASVPADAGRRAHDALARQVAAEAAE